jgi:hypothetical protein
MRRSTTLRGAGRLPRPLAAEAAIAWCNGCKGVWVSEAELEERVRFVRGMNEFKLEMVFGPGSRAARR